MNGELEQTMHIGNAQSVNRFAMQREYMMQRARKRALAKQELPENIFEENTDATDESEKTVFENNIQFGVRFRGYDRTEVDDYIAAITEDYNKMCERMQTVSDENAILSKGILVLTEKLALLE